jgi:phytoene dehydrogenase-like protein
MKEKQGKYDAIVIGAGHNGLVTAAYLARQGRKVAIFEKRDVVGGCAVTESPWEGYKVSSLAYVNSLFHPQIVEDLKLKDHGFEMIPRVPSSFTPFPDGRHLLLGPDKQFNIEQISKFSKKDAEAYPRYETMLDEIAEVIEPVLLMTPPNPGKLAIGEMFQYGKFLWKNKPNLKKNWSTLTRLMAGSAIDMLDEWFESEELKVTLATDAVIGVNAGPASPGTAYVLFHHVMGECNGVRGVWGYMKGGMGGLSNSIASSCKAMGVDIFTSSGIAKINVKDGRAQGVVTEAGDDYECRILATGADCNITFTKLMDKNDLPDDFLQDVKRINYDSASVKINLALAELPNFKACPGTEISPWHHGTIHISPNMQYVIDAYADSVAGRPSRSPIIEATLPSALDPSVVPEGKHLMNCFVQYGPFDLRNGLSWDEEKGKFLNRVIEILGEYAPNLPGSVLHSQIITPVDMENEYNLTGGNLFHGRMSLDQMFHMRPVPGYANYKTPLKNMYICGSSAHPGGGVMGIPGWNAARMILDEHQN